MASPNSPEGQAPVRSSDAALPSRSRIEETLVKSSIWKQQTLRDIEYSRELAASETSDQDSETARLIHRLSAQLDERNDEIERLRQSVSKLKKQRSQLGLAYKREVASGRARLQGLQDAYEQFEKESDSLLAELVEQNERLLDECRHENVRSLLE